MHARTRLIPRVLADLDLIGSTDRRACAAFALARRGRRTDPGDGQHEVRSCARACRCRAGRNIAPRARLCRTRTSSSSAGVFMSKRTKRCSTPTKPRARRAPRRADHRAALSRRRADVRAARASARPRAVPRPRSRGAVRAGPLRRTLVETVGELGKLYAAADIAFVGGSLFFRGSNKGGHNLMEPAIVAVPVLFGPYNFSSRRPLRICSQRTPAWSLMQAELATRIAARRDGTVRRELGLRAQRVVRAGQGATVTQLRFHRRAHGCASSACGSG